MGIASGRGRAGEALAIAYLELIGFRVRARNVRLGGVEVDALVEDGATRVLVEVKVRSRGDYGGAAMAVDRAKQARLRRAALAIREPEAGPVRVDVVAVELLADGASIHHVRNAVTG